MLAACPRGVGNDDFMEKIAPFKSPQEVLNSDQFTLDGYKLGYQRILRLARWGSGGKMFIVTQMDKNTARKLFFKPFDSLENAITEAKKMTTDNPHIAVLPDGILTVPIPKVEK